MVSCQKNELRKFSFVVYVCVLFQSYLYIFLSNIIKENRDNIKITDGSCVTSITIAEATPGNQNSARSGQFLYNNSEKAIVVVAFKGSSAIASRKAVARKEGENKRWWRVAVMSPGFGLPVVS